MSTITHPVPVPRLSRTVVAIAAVCVVLAVVLAIAFTLDSGSRTKTGTDAPDRLAQLDADAAAERQAWASLDQYLGSDQHLDCRLGRAC